MTIPTFIDWTWTYLSLLPVRWQGGTGGCWGATICYMMEMRAILQGYPARQLAMRYNMWTDGYHDNAGSNAIASFEAAKSFGVCLESLMPMPAYIGVDTTTPAYSTATWAAVQTTPSPEAVADGLNQTIVSWDPMFYYFNQPELKTKVQTAIASGHPLAVLTATRTHVMCAWGYDDGGLIGLDSRSQNAFPYHLDWSQIGGIAGVIGDVKFANATKGIAPAMLPKPDTPPPVIIIPPPPITIGNTQMLIDTIKTQANALTLGQISQTQIDAIKASVSQLVPDNVATLPPTGTSPTGTTVPPATSITDDLGAIWTIDGIGDVRRDGARAGGFFASKLAWQVEARNNNKLSIAATNKDNGSVSYWDGSRWLWAGR